MRVSIIFTLFFTVYLTSQASKAESTCVNVNHTDNGTKSFRLRGSGHTCGDFPLVVSKTGFQLKVYTSPKSTTPNQGYLRIYFGNVSVPFSFVNSPAELSIYTSNDIYLGRAILGVTTIEIQSNGVGFVAPQKTSFASIKIPSLEEFQRYQQDKVIIKFKIEWTNVNDLVIELPNFINNTKNSPPKLTTKTPKSTKTVNYTGNNESITNSAILTSTARATSNATSKASWIVIAAPSNEINRFNIPIDPNSRITDHGINFNDYLAVVPAYPEEIREFENAEKKKKDEMYVGFLERIQVAERTENKGSK
uniref:Uncharacterized protein n=1 Tax=Panagrellus redivivus TaxID=6233 RepID=A0A7E4VLX6_PANRE